MATRVGSSSKEKQKPTRQRRRRSSPSHLRPVAGMMDRLSNMSLDELERAKQRSRNWAGRLVPAPRYSCTTGKT